MAAPLLLELVDRRVRAFLAGAAPSGVALKDVQLGLVADEATLTVFFIRRLFVRRLFLSSPAVRAPAGPGPLAGRVAHCGGGACAIAAARVQSPPPWLHLGPKPQAFSANRMEKRRPWRRPFS